MTYATAFRDTATLPDPSGRYRTCIILASRIYGEWSDEAKAEYVRKAPRPSKALRLTSAEYDRLEANKAERFGYVDSPGDVDSPFEPAEWINWR